MPLGVKTTIELEKDSLRECVKEQYGCQNRVQKWGHPKSATQQMSCLTPGKRIYTPRSCPIKPRRKDAIGYTPIAFSGGTYSLSCGPEAVC